MYVKYIDLLGNEYSEFNNGEKTKIKLEKTNIFIGKNNSGKSRLMRQVLINEYNKKYYINDNVDDFIQLKQCIEEVIDGANEYTLELYSKTYLCNEKIKSKVYRNENDEEILGIFICNLVYSEDYHSIYNKLQNFRIIKNNYSFRSDSNISLASFKRNAKNRIINLYNNIIDKMEEVTPKTLFFPSILSLRKLNNINEEIVQSYHLGISKMFYNDYFSKLKDFNNYIKTGQEIYSDMKKQLLGLNKDREKFLEYEKYIGENFFDNKEISIFIKDDDNNIYVQEDNEQPYPIYFLGDGLQTLITITYYLFMNNNIPLKVFIDEPEIHLHPGLQRLLVSKLQEFENSQFFITTHSSSMIDICDEYDENTSIICIEKKDCQKNAYNSAYDDMNLYDLIGIRPSSIILSNCTIWVEGPTDIYYIESFLKIYSQIKNKKEFLLGYNYNYAFNGSINIASKIDFDNDKSASMKISKLSKNNFIIFDNDNLNKENANYQKIYQLKCKLGESCHVINKLKTIENIIPPEFFHEYYDSNYNSNDKKIKPLVLKFFDKIAEDYGTDKYFQLDMVEEMAEYINNHIGKKDLKKYRKYCKSLWNSNKYNMAVNFSSRIQNMNQLEQTELIEKTMKGFISMIIKIYKFIDKNN